ncbi:hypothetical protein GGQ87_000242 [Brevundimonas alba]|uniref:Uncharacterized protein n=1 Tax=Brevundimonas alba TaxID=74314 RepID=A0A7X5YJU4_9CAUL|nr:hypothetical protein [Brevundimonas alba]NJC39984.1 hypothetical protein [Brevundimonas alba]
MTDPVDRPVGVPPLAEGRWLWRRLYVFASTGAAWLLLDRLIVLTPPDATLPLAKGLMGLMALTMILYLVAPTAQQLIASLRTLRPGGEGR